MFNTSDQHAQAQEQEIERLRTALTNIAAKSHLESGESLMHIRWRFGEIATTARDALIFINVEARQ